MSAVIVGVIKMDGVEYRLHEDYTWTMKYVNNRLVTKGIAEGRLRLIRRYADTEVDNGPSAGQPLPAMFYGVLNHIQKARTGVTGTFTPPPRRKPPEGWKPGPNTMVIDRNEILY